MAIEINYTNSSINDLAKYHRLKIAEVWIWQRFTERPHGRQRVYPHVTRPRISEQGRLRFFSWKRDRYTEVNNSGALPLTASAFLSDFLNTAVSDDNLTLETRFYRELG